MRTDVLCDNSAHIPFLAVLHSANIAVALQRELAALLLNDAVQDIVARGNLSQDCIADIITVALLQKDAVAGMLNEGPHAVSFDIDGVGLAFAQHLRHFAQPGIIGQFVARLIGDCSIALVVASAPGSQQSPSQSFNYIFQRAIHPYFLISIP